MSDRMTLEEGLTRSRMLTAVEINSPFGVQPIHLHEDPVTFNGDGIRHGIEHQRRRSDGNAILLGRGFGIHVRHGGLSFFGNRPLSNTVEEAIELGAW